MIDREMTPKMMLDEDGDIPPCSVMWSLKEAQRWDDMKQQKYGGKQKAPSMVEAFNQSQEFEKKYKHPFGHDVPVLDIRNMNKENLPPLTPQLRRSWWQTLIACFKPTK